MQRRNAFRILGLGAALAAVGATALVALNVTGAAPISVGPLGDHQPAVRDVADMTIDYRPGDAPYYLTPLVENNWPVPVTIVRVTPIGVSGNGSVDVIGSLPFDVDGSDGQAVLGIQTSIGPVWAHPEPVTGVSVEPRHSPGHDGRAFLVRITPDPDHGESVQGFDVEYTVGPFHFLTTAWGPVGTAVVVCGRDAPMPAEDGCKPSR